MPTAFHDISVYTIGCTDATQCQLVVKDRVTYVFVRTQDIQAFSSGILAPVMGKRAPADVVRGKCVVWSLQCNNPREWSTMQYVMSDGQVGVDGGEVFVTANTYSPFKEKSDSQQSGSCGAMVFVDGAFYGIHARYSEMAKKNYPYYIDATVPKTPSRIVTMHGHAGEYPGIDIDDKAVELKAQRVGDTVRLMANRTENVAPPHHSVRVTALSSTQLTDDILELCKRRVAIGDVESLRTIHNTNTAYNGYWLQEELERRVGKILDVVGDIPHPPTWEEVLGFKTPDGIDIPTMVGNLSSTCGAPFRGLKKNQVIELFAAGRVKNTRTKQVYPSMACWLRDCEERLTNGKTSMYITVFGKRDKYSPEKIEKRNYRAIYNCDLVTNLVMLKYTKSVSSRLSQFVPEFYLSRRHFEWNKILHSRFVDKYTIGLDVTAFDKQIPASVTEYIVRACMIRGGATDRLARTISSSVAYAPVVMPDGEVLERYGGNPSGQQLTTIVNSVYSYLVLEDMFCELLDLEEGKVYAPHGPVSIAITGDDNIVGLDAPAGFSAEDLHKASSRFGLKYKMDLYNGGWYPPGNHAPYLSRRTVVSDNRKHGVFVPSDPYRTLTALLYLPQDDAAATEIVAGVAQEFAGWSYICDSHLYQDPDSRKTDADRRALQILAIARSKYPKVKTFNANELAAHYGPPTVMQFGVEGTVMCHNTGATWADHAEAWNKRFDKIFSTHEFDVIEDPTGIVHPPPDPFDGEPVEETPWITGVDVEDEFPDDDSVVSGLVSAVVEDLSAEAADINGTIDWPRREAMMATIEQDILWRYELTPGTKEGLEDAAWFSFYRFPHATVFPVVQDANSTGVEMVPIDLVRRLLVALVLCYRCLGQEWRDYINSQGTHPAQLVFWGLAHYLNRPENSDMASPLSVSDLAYAYTPSFFILGEKPNMLTWSVACMIFNTVLPALPDTVFHSEILLMPGFWWFDQPARSWPTLHA